MLRLDKKIDLLVIIDMVNGFVHEGAFANPHAAKMLPTMKVFIDRAVENGIEILHYTDSHRKDALEFASYPVHCLKGTSESKPVAEVDRPQITIIQKNSTNGFIVKNPFDFSKNIYIIGCVTDICIFQFAQISQKFREEYSLPYTVNVISDLVATFDAPGHDKDEYQEKALSELRETGVNIINL